MKGKKMKKTYKCKGQGAGCFRDVSGGLKLQDDP